MVRGEVHLRTCSENLTVPMECVIVEKVIEVLIGIDWPTRNVEQSDFCRPKIAMFGREIALPRAARKGALGFMASPKTR